MREFFEPSIRETLSLIDTQIAQIADHNLGKPKVPTYMMLLTPQLTATSIIV